MPTDADGLPITRSPDWMLHGIDPTVPNAARMYDHWLGGAHNFAVDREMANKIQQFVPAARDGARVNRAFLRRVVRFMVDSGIRQFLDIGSGIPTVGNVHEIAQRITPECRVVYVDKESSAVAHSNLLLQSNNRAKAIQANLRDAEYIFDHPQTKRLLDLDQPIGLLMLWVLHFVPDSWDPLGILTRYRDRLVPGSYLAVSHVATDGNPTGQAETVELFATTPDPLYLRTYADVLRFFGEFELVEPGLVGSAYWRPSGPGDISDNAEMNSVSCGGVGRKP